MMFQTQIRVLSPCEHKAPNRKMETTHEHKNKRRKDEEHLKNSKLPIEKQKMR